MPCHGKRWSVCVCSPTPTRNLPSRLCSSSAVVGRLDLIYRRLSPHSPLPSTRVPLWFARRACKGPLQESTFTCGQEQLLEADGSLGRLQYLSRTVEVFFKSFRQKYCEFVAIPALTFRRKMCGPAKSTLCSALRRTSAPSSAARSAAAVRTFFARSIFVTSVPRWRSIPLSLYLRPGQLCRPENTDFVGFPRLISFCLHCA